MKFKSVLCTILMMFVLALTILYPAPPVLAAETSLPGLALSADKAEINAGDELTVTAALTGYDNLEVGALYSLNIEVPVDTAIFEFVSLNDDALYDTMGRNGMLTSNYNTEEELIILAYNATTTTATLPRDVTGLFEFTLKVGEDLGTAKTLEIPVNLNVRFDADRTLTVSIPVESLSLAVSRDSDWVPIISTVAGIGRNEYSGDGGLAVMAGLSTNDSLYSSNMITDTAGNLYITGGNRLRVVAAENGIIFGVEVKKGNIYTIAGTGTAGFSGDGGPATTAQLNRPTGVALDSAGNLYISDSTNRRIRMITPDGVITTVAGTGTQGVASDGDPATVANMVPYVLLIDAQDNIYFANGLSSFDGFYVCMIPATDCEAFNKSMEKGKVYRIAGNGLESGTITEGADALSGGYFGGTNGLALDKAGNLYLSSLYSKRVIKVDANTRTVTTIAGTGSASILISGMDGPAKAANIGSIQNIVIDSKDNLYISTSLPMSQVRQVFKVDALDGTGIITVVAGNDTTSPGSAGDGGPAKDATLHQINGLALDEARGYLYIINFNIGTVRMVDLGSGVIVNPPIPAAHTVTFDYNDEATSPVDEQVEDGALVIKPADPVREGFTFLGWYLAGAEEAFGFETTPITGNITLTAKWKPIVAGPVIYTVIFMEDVGEYYGELPVEEGQTVPEPPAPGKIGYTFAGWYLEGATEAFVFETTPITGNITLTAHWQPIVVNPVIYTVTFMEDVGEFYGSLQVESGKAAPEPPAPGKIGFTFAGWYLEGATEAFVFETTPITGNITLTAHWKPITPDPATYTVTFLDWDGALLDEQQVAEGQDAVAPEEPAREGYTFTGWSVDFSNVTEDLNVVAQYEMIPVIPEVIKDELAALVTAAYDLDPEGYTGDSWTAFSAALSAAQTILGNDDATQAEVDGARDDLQLAISKLEPVETEIVNKDALAALVAAADALDSADYTAARWSAFADARSAAKAVLGNNEATQGEVNSAANALQATQSALVALVLSEIRIASLPELSSYTAGETLDLTGLAVEAEYNDGSVKSVTGYTTNPAAGAVLYTVGEQTVTVSYTEKSVTQTVDFCVAVSAAPVLYTITFNYNYTGSPASITRQTDAAGQLSGLPEAPARAGYAFEGWFTAASGGDSVTAETVFANNATVYAKWAYNGGSGSGKTYAVITASPVSDVTLPVEFTVSLRGTNGATTVAFTFEADGNMLTPANAEALNGFSLVEAINWTDPGDGKLQGTLTLVYKAGTQESFTSTAPVDVLKLVFDAQGTGDATVKLTGMEVSGIVEMEPAWLDSAIEAGEATTSVEEVTVYSVYDLNKDGVVDQLDLTVVVLYCQYSANASDWETALVVDRKGADITAKMCDFNEDGAVNMLDLTELFLNYTGK